MNPEEGFRTVFQTAFRRRANAVADIRGSARFPSIRGRVLFYQIQGGVLVVADIYGLPRSETNGLPQPDLNALHQPDTYGMFPKAASGCVSPVFAFHIHAGASCMGNETDPFANANGHYNPTNCSHPYHAGDLPPLFSANGHAFSVVLTDRFTVREIINRTIIIHSGVDDFTSQPAGNAGEKIACGRITQI